MNFHIYTYLVPPPHHLTAFDALDKQYLRCIIFSITSAEEEESQRELLER